MPVTLNPIGTTLDISVFDGNMETLQNLFKEQLQEADFAERFTRFRISQYVSGKFISQRIMANPFKDTSKITDTRQQMELFDLTYCKAGNAPGKYHSTATSRSFEFDNSGSDEAYEYEILGFPGPSFHYAWQEEGLSTAGVTGIDFEQRFPPGICYSRWLTIPGASARVYIPEKARLNIRGSFLAQPFHWHFARQDINSGSYPTPGGELDELNGFMRLGIIIDTNPNIYEQEFPNTNPHILNRDGTQASWKSWKIVEDRTMRIAPRCKQHLSGEVIVEGRRWYNIRFAYREAGHRGWVNRDTNTFVNKTWENSHASHAGVTNAAVAHTAFGSLEPYAPTWTALWENSGLDIEAHYGRGFTYKHDSSDAEFDTIFDTL